MSRLRRSAGALLLSVVVCASASTGPAFAGTDAPPAAGAPLAHEPAAEVPAVAEPVVAEPVVDAPVAGEPGADKPGADKPGADKPGARSAPVAVEPVADPVAATVDLTISVTFDKPEFFVDEQVVARARVTNRGTTTATGTWLLTSGNVVDREWTGFPDRVEPGQTVEGVLTSWVRTADAVLTLEVEVHGAQPDANPADNTTTASVPMKVHRGGYTGVVYGDRDGDKAMDPGEALAGLTITATGGVPRDSYTATTDPAGRFTFRDLPRGSYTTSIDSVQWVFQPPGVDVGGADEPDVVLRGAWRVTSVLTAAASFDRQTYRLGETARLSLVLTNGGPDPIPGITAQCYSTGAALPDLGDLVDVGVTVPAHATWTTSTSIGIDAEAAEGGALVVGCTFGSPPNSNGTVSARAIARVPGARADRVVGQVGFSGRLPAMSPRPGPPLPNVKVYLKDQVTGAVIVRATTDAQGRFEFRDVPAGVHDFGLVGPYASLSGERFQEVHVRAGPFQDLNFLYVTHGPDQPDPDPAPRPGDPSAPAPPAGPGHRPTLAATGANVAWLAPGRAARAGRGHRLGGARGAQARLTK
ncbi:hypothetical protein LZG04_28240 [Saccharothrix sp. S26]|uniref:hypothetical protein n=1 Tax=Saccharothrix sp. S26 TaxID=2907215 RepID=UPI001F2CFCAC|nr:hypothetical protein [Saccharothrix sp. S26]MCE6998658.1 hypothetical protein [Saccharothrix sp. S26]